MPSFNMTPEREAKIRTMIHHRQPTLTVVMENVNDPHNIMAVARSCESVGIPQIHIIHDKNQPGFDIRKEGSRSSASANKWISFKNYSSTKACFDQLKQDGFLIYSTHLSTDAISIHEVDMTQKIALVFGNEKHGISDEALSLSDGNFIIPQVGMIQSLNISVACAVSVYEAFRQRKLEGFYNQPQYTKLEVEQIMGNLSK